MVITTTTAMYSLGHRLRTLPAVPRSTQPSTLRGMVKWVSAFGLSNNNKWRWWMCMVAAFISGLTAQIGSLGLRVGSHPALSLHSSNEPDELSQWLWSWRQHHKHYRYYYVVVIINQNRKHSEITEKQKSIKIRSDSTSSAAQYIGMQQHMTCIV